MAEIKKITISVPEDLEAKYVNVSYITHTPQEFILDFASLLPGIKDPSINTRLIFSPLGAKLLIQALNENLRRYEANFGPIRVPSGHTLADQLFKGSSPQEPGKE